MAREMAIFVVSWPTSGVKFKCNLTSSYSFSMSAGLAPFTIMGGFGMFGGKKETISLSPFSTKGPPKSIAGLLYGFF